MVIDFFLLGTTLILTHEMDAIRCKEWRLFPGLSLINDKIGLIAFVFLHIPLFYWVLFEIQLNYENFVLGFDIFLIIHFFLHLLFLMHKKNEFKDWTSWTIISGAGLCGLFDIIIELVKVFKVNVDKCFWCIISCTWCSFGS